MLSVWCPELSRAGMRRGLLCCRLQEVAQAEDVQLMSDGMSAMVFNRLSP